MKKILLILSFFVGVLMIHSCKIDDFDAPSATLQGTVLDNKGEALQVEQGQGNTKIKLEELSWSSTPTPMYLNMIQDGSYVNHKLFAGKYRVTPIEGPFYPITGDEFEINGTTTHDFHVLPYVDIQWVGDPVLTADKKISATFKYVRNEPPAGQTRPNVADYRIFISTTKYVGNNNFDPANGLVTVAGNANENTDITVTTSAAMKYATTYYVRIGIKVNDTYKKYNYTTVKTVTVP